jgi:cellulose synthase/poly-beta-1,6-N-acetylglucosamine synthase-like glycosyltransferase
VRLFNDRNLSFDFFVPNVFLGFCSLKRFVGFFALFPLSYCKYAIVLLQTICAPNVLLNFMRAQTFCTFAVELLQLYVRFFFANFGAPTRFVRLPLSYCDYAFVFLRTFAHSTFCKFVSLSYCNYAFVLLRTFAHPTFYTLFPLLWAPAYIFRLCNCIFAKRGFDFCSTLC